MKVTQADILSLVHYDGVGVGDVKAVLYDSGTQKHVIVSPHEGEHPVFKHLGFHLAVCHAYFHIGYQPVEDFLY